MWKINYSKWHMQGEPNSIPLILVIKSDFHNLFGIIPTFTKVRFGTDYLNQRGVWNAHVFRHTLSTCSHLPGETVLVPYVILSKLIGAVYTPWIMWITEIHHTIYSTRCFCIQLGFVVFQCRGVVLRKRNTKHFSYFIQVAERNQTKTCGAARLWLSLRAHSTERFQMCQQSCPLQLGQVLLILPKWSIRVGHCRDHDSCHRSTWYDMKGPRGFALYTFCLICWYVKGSKKQISNWSLYWWRESVSR